MVACLFGLILTLSAQTLSVDKHVSAADGLSNDFVISLAIDGQGHVWVATEAGVNRIAADMCQPLTAEPLSGRITALHWHGPSGNMLIGTERGLTLYNIKRGSMHHMNGGDGLVASSINDIADSSDGGVWLVYGNGKVQHLNCATLEARTLELNLPPGGNRCVMDDGNGHLYIGHSQQGMTVVNLADGSMTTYRQAPAPQSGTSLPGNNVRCIYQDLQGNIWVGTDSGLALFHPTKTGDGTFTQVTDADNSYDDNVYDVRQMADGQLWVATDIGGVKIVNLPSYSLSTLHSSLTPLISRPLQVAGLSSLNVRSIVEDDYGNIWVGNHSTGVDFIGNGIHDFHLLDYKDLRGRHPSVSAIVADQEQGYWTASENELAQWQEDSIKGRWSILSNMRREYVFPRSLMVDHQGGIWLGIDDQGVYRFDKLSQQFAHIPITPEGSDIHSFAETADGRVWIGGEFGVYCYEKGRAVLQEYVSQTIHAPATCIIETAPDQLFIATLGDGIFSINQSTGTCRHLSISDGLPSSKVNHTIRTQSGELWLATDGGLVRVADPVALTGITVYGKEQGLNDCHILALQQDANGNIWMSTYSGIACFVKSSSRFYNYNHQDTRLSGGFANGAAMTGADGTVYFGFVGGVCCFNPQRMGGGGQLSEIQIISCEAYNPVGNNTEIQYLRPDDKGRVFTTYQHNTIRLTFATRNYAQTTAVDYSYRMEGMDGKWYDIGNDHDVVFRGLRPGQYTFILRAKLRNQDWSQAKETRLTIVIAPPFWRTWWAYMLYALLTIAAVAYLVVSYKRKLMLRNALELERRESQQRQQLNEERLRFFTNVTHELRTPLTLILGPLEDLVNDEQIPPTRRRLVGVILKNAERLRDLIGEILEFRKSETQNRRLTVARGDIGQFVREICLNYEELNSNPEVKFVCNVANDLPKVWFDSEVVNTVLHNLLSNAVKYTEQGSITITVKTEGNMLTISVADTGYGIAPEALPHVFERYYQAKGSHQASGTGIGLALVKSLVELHEGSVGVESRQGQGSTFTFTIKTDNTYPNALHKEDGKEETLKSEALERSLLTADGQDSWAQPSTQGTDARPLLLVVEDNDDIRQYIADSLGDDFRILTAQNGQEGLQMATESMPDIVVSDIMMPKMNGIELTRRLKGDILTSHIPIVLLTAKTTDDDKEEGYDSGADSYLTKPFTTKLLASRIRNLLNARRRLAELLVAAPPRLPSPDLPAGSRSDAPPSEETGEGVLSRLDQEFINKLNLVIEENIMQTDIDMAFVTDRMAMSHSTFYRKVKALTGMTAAEYIRKRRLYHCYRLLQSGDYNVNQAAMMTGFNQMAHFRETFKREFGILPSEVKKNLTPHPLLKERGADGSSSEDSGSRGVQKRFLTLLAFAVGYLAFGHAAAVYDVRDFGALGDGQHIDSPALNAALEQAAKEGGGTVVLAPGTYLCYSIHLQSNTTLRLERGAVLRAAPVTDVMGYDEAEPNPYSQYQDFGHSHWHNSLLWGENLHHVTLEGEGLIDGTDVLSRGGGQRRGGTIAVADKALAMRDCRNVVVRGLSFLNCGHFALLLTGVDHLLIDGVTCDTNRDGFDIDCCEHVVVRNCRVNTLNDDAIVLKCSYALGRPKPTEHVLIEDCHVSGYDVGTLLSGTCTKRVERAPDGDGPTGRIKLGTESNGGFRHITIRRCTFTHCRGLALESVDGAEMRDIRVSDLLMTDICNSPLYIRLGCRMRAPEGFHRGSVSDVSIRNVYVTDADSRYACLIAGEEGLPVRNVTIRNLYVLFRGGLTMRDVEEQRGSNPFFFGRNGQALINRHEKAEGYPEPSAHGIQPAWGLSISHAENIRLKNVRMETVLPDERPQLHFENTRNIRLSHSSSPVP